MKRLAQERRSAGQDAAWREAVEKNASAPTPLDIEAAAQRRARTLGATACRSAWRLLLRPRRSAASGPEEDEEE